MRYLSSRNSCHNELGVLILALTFLTHELNYNVQGMISNTDQKLIIFRFCSWYALQWLSNSILLKSSKAKILQRKTIFF